MVRIASASRERGRRIRQREMMGGGQDGGSWIRCDTHGSTGWRVWTVGTRSEARETTVGDDPGNVPARQLGTTNHAQTVQSSWTASAARAIAQKSSRTHFRGNESQSHVERKLVIRIPVVLLPPTPGHPPRRVAHKHRFVHIDLEAALGVEGGDDLEHPDVGFAVDVVFVQRC